MLPISDDQAYKGRRRQKSLTSQVGKGGRKHGTEAHNRRKGVEPEGTRYRKSNDERE
mgnify:CR=1 FL=1